MPASICDRKPGETANDALTSVAQVSQMAMNTLQQSSTSIDITYPPNQQDYAVQWVQQGPQPPAILPPFPESVAFLTAFDASSAVRRVRATAMMDAYYDLDIEALPQGNLDAQNARANLATQQAAIELLITLLESGGINFRGFRQNALQITGQLAGLTGYLEGLDPSMAAIPCIQQCQTLCADTLKTLNGLQPTLSTAEANQVIRATMSALDTVRRALSSMLTGYAIVTNNMSIPNFFLLRLLVGYKIAPSQSATMAYASVASAQLTALLHNKQTWLFDLLQAMIADLSLALTTRFGNRVSFFLKGGRGLKYLLLAPTEGENDWDTQVLIDPALPPEQWWATYDEVREIVNNCLLRADFVFSANLMANAPTLIGQNATAALTLTDDIAKGTEGIYDSLLALATQASLDDQAFVNDQDMFLESMWQDANRQPSGNCKAELIDVGIPRYYTIELLEQWTHVRPGVSAPHGVPYPDAPYFIDEFIGMIRECYAGVSPSPSKLPKRMKRLISVLNPQVAGYAAFLTAQTQAVTAARLVDAPRQITAITNAQASALASIMLGEFASAYQLASDPNLAEVFDEMASQKLDPNAVNTAAGDTGPMEQVFQWCQSVSDEMQAHLAERGRFLTGNNLMLASLSLRTTQCQSLQVRPVFDGAYAACLHQMQPGAQVIRNSVAPAEFAVVNLYLPQVASLRTIPQQTFQNLAAEITTMAGQILGGVGNTPFFGAVVPDFASLSINVFAATPIPLGQQGGGYMPLTIRFRLMVLPAALPTVTNQQQQTFMALQPLVLWCRGLAADTNEWATRLKLTESFGALIELSALQNGVRV